MLHPICARLHHFAHLLSKNFAETCSMRDEKFKIRTYGFGELAQLYLPETTPMSASNRLRIWIDRNSRLSERLRTLGWVKYSKLLTPEMVKEIVRVIGEP